MKAHIHPPYRTVVYVICKSNPRFKAVQGRKKRR